MTQLTTFGRAGLAVVVLAVAVPAASAAQTSPAAATATTYTVRDLGSLGFGVTDPAAINGSGQVTGYSYLSKEIQVPCPPGQYGRPKKCFEAPYHAFIWSNGTMTDLGTLGGNFSAANAINGSGAAVGWAQTKAGSSDAALWNAPTITDLARLGVVGAFGINDSGQIAGMCTDATGDAFACVVRDSTVSALAAPAAFPDCNEAIAINNKSQVVGTCGDAQGDLRAVVWTNGSPTVLPTLGGPQISPSAINNLGQVTGYAMTSTDAQHGFLWSNGQMTDLGLNFYAAAINDNDVIVGGNEIYSNGTIHDLNALITPGSPYQINYATGINDAGQIAAKAYDTTANQIHGVTLTPN
jgi:probable HAF family extracellular repeat protein